MITLALHEAAHAVVWTCLNIPVRSVSISPLPGSPARCRTLEKMGAVEPQRWVAGLLASRHGVRLYSVTVDACDADDRAKAHAIAGALFAPDKAQAWLAACEAVACAQVHIHARWIHAVADALLRRRSLSGEEVLGLRPRAADLKSSLPTPRDGSMKRRLECTL